MSTRPREASASTLRPTNKYVREYLHTSETPPRIEARFFYTSPLAIDDPLSPLPPPATGTNPFQRQPPRPFSLFDNANLDKAWHDLRLKILKHNEDARGEKLGLGQDVVSTPSAGRSQAGESGDGKGATGLQRTPRRQTLIEELRNPSRPRTDSVGSSKSATGKGRPHSVSVSNPVRALDPSANAALSTETTTTGNPFVRAPLRPAEAGKALSSHRPVVHLQDSYEWDVEDELAEAPPEEDKSVSQQKTLQEAAGLSVQVPVGVSRLHNVIMPELRMEPIYWSPVHDIAAVARATWFYKDTMLPMEVDVANMLEAGYVAMQPWTQTWTDELNSAVEVGAVGEMKIMHKLWPDLPLRARKSLDSRPGTSSGTDGAVVHNTLDSNQLTPEQEREKMVLHAADLIDISTGPNGPDNKADGNAPFGKDGRVRRYLDAGIIYANNREAYILRPSLQPSAYYGRRPLANYIRKGHKIGICVVRGFDQAAWDKIHPVKNNSTAMKALQGVSTSQAGVPESWRQMLDPTLAMSERPRVTDLVFVIHGIGQKLSERIESFHFTHAINAFRREVHVELATDSVKANLRKDMGGIMVLPVNWRAILSFEEGGYRDAPEDPALNQYSLKDITPDTLPSVRNIISDVMLDIPYYLSHHQPKMIAAVMSEANRIYRLWCRNNLGFEEYGRVHILAHSLGSVMAVDILSRQPTNITPNLSDTTNEHFAFDTKNLFLAGSPAGFFLLLKRATLLPRRNRHKPGSDGHDISAIAGEQDTYGCISVDNIYNIVNPYDPVAYRLNATVDATYAASLRPAYVPSSSTGWFNPFRSIASSASTAEAAVGMKPSVGRLPSNVELETHNFTREEIAEKRAYLLNDNGQIDYFLRYGGGTFEIQYLTMLGAHSSYWLSKDFVRMVVNEVGRAQGRAGTLLNMRAVKKKQSLTG